MRMMRKFLDSQNALTYVTAAAAAALVAIWNDVIWLCHYNDAMDYWETPTYDIQHVCASYNKNPTKQQKIKFRCMREMNREWERARETMAGRFLLLILNETNVRDRDVWLIILIYSLYVHIYIFVVSAFTILSLKTHKNYYYFSMVSHSQMNWVCVFKLHL